MLSRLTISNYALINELEVRFNKNLNTITGETGAGKSIILGALGLIIGNRADLSVLKNKDAKCIAEGQFEIKDYNLNLFFEENDLDYDDSTILRREITPAGKSRAFINDTPVNLKIMRELGLKLIDIHSQHQNLALSNQKFQLNLVDAVASSQKELANYQAVFSDYKKTKKQLAELIENSEKAKANLDYFQFQYNQLEEAGLEENEQEQLEEELEQLTHAEDIKTAFSEVSNMLDNETYSVLQNLKDACRSLSKISSFHKEAKEISDRLESSSIELNDLHNEINLLEEQVEFNPQRIEEVNNRLSLIYSLQQKHHVATNAELIELKNDFEEKINRAVSFEDEIFQTKNTLLELETKLEKAANSLTKVREKAFPKIEKSVISDLKDMGMSKAKLQITREAYASYQPDGRDGISFLFSANVDTVPDEISKIASGGEMSRLMLAIKNLLRLSKALPTIIFDEIDSGVSGKIAYKMGEIIKSFSSNTQIINITHLPQIAAKGDAHFVVYKQETKGKTFTSIKELNKSERIEELAKMVGGEKITETALNAAKELLEDE